MATKTSDRAKAIAEKWLAGTKHYQDEYQPTADKIHNKAKEMRDSGADPADIVAMAVEENVNFAQKYHEHETE